MTWNRYYQETRDGIEENDRETERTWEAALLLLLLLESRTRRATVRLAGRLPLIRGLVDTKARDDIRRFRSGVRGIVADAIADLEVGLIGKTAPGLPDFSKPGTVRGIQGNAIRNVARRFSERWDRLRGILKRDMEDWEPPAPGTPGSEAPGPDPGKAPDSREPMDWLHPDHLELLEELDPEGGQDQRELDDQEEILSDAPVEVVRNGRWEWERFQETVAGRLATSSRDEILDYVNGTDDARQTRSKVTGNLAPGSPMHRRTRGGDLREHNPPTGGWRANRGWMKLSIASHVRAMHRRRAVTEALADGIVHFRLDIPSRRLGKIDPQGQLGPHLWRVRDYEAWLEVQKAANSGRIASSSFPGLGFGFGDLSYIVPVPAIHLDAAVRQGAGFRKRWLDSMPARAKKKGAA